MGKIRRNDPCPCNSGKKFKKCCLGKIYFDTEINMNIYPELYVIGDLLSHSERFRHFYSTKRKKIKFDFSWAHNNHLERGINAQTSRRMIVDLQERTVSSPKCYIEINQVPATLGYQITIAHEIEHFILDSKGFPHLSTSLGPFQPLCHAFYSMVQDPVVQKMLLPFKFNLKKYFVKELKEDIRQITAFNSSPKHPLDRTRWIFHFICRMLEWNVIIGDKQENEYLRIYTQKHPDIVDECKSLLKNIEEYSIDTPEGQLQIIKYLFNEFDFIKDNIFVIDIENKRFIEIN